MIEVAVDLGTTFVKAALIDSATGTITASARVRSPRNTALVAGRHELDPDRLVTVARDLIEQVTAGAGPAGLVRICSQMQGFVLTDPHGEPVTPMVTWQDHRSLERLGGRPSAYQSAAVAVQEAGLTARPSLPIFKLLWFRQVHPELFAGGGPLFHTVGGYLAHRLSGGAHFLHASSAAATGMTGPDRQWNAALLRDLGLASLRLPEIVDEHARAARTGSVEVGPDIGDHQAGHLGSDPGARADAVVFAGTAGIVSAVADGAAPPGAELRPYFGGRDLATVTGLPGGRVADIVARLVTSASADRDGDLDDAWSRIDRGDERHLPRSVPPPTVGVTRNELGAHQVSIHGLTGDNASIGRVMSALSRHLAQEFAAAVQVLTGPVARRVVFSGGLAVRSPELCATTADRLTGASYAIAPADASLRGLLELSRREARLDVR